VTVIRVKANRQGNQTEAQFTRMVIDVAHLFHWRVAHFDAGRARSGKWCTSMIGDAGFPDLVLTNGQRCVFAELKIGRGRATNAQERWLDDLRGAGMEAYVWSPADWETIEEILRGTP
jgi:hypothetical protein